LRSMAMVRVPSGGKEKRRGATGGGSQRNDRRGEGVNGKKTRRTLEANKAKAKGRRKTG